eukprot:EG_transcript_27744
MDFHLDRLVGTGDGAVSWTTPNNSSGFWTFSRRRWQNPVRFGWKGFCARDNFWWSVFAKRYSFSKRHWGIRMTERLPWAPQRDAAIAPQHHQHVATREAAPKRGVGQLVRHPEQQRMVVGDG